MWRLLALILIPAAVMAAVVDLTLPAPADYPPVPDGTYAVRIQKVIELNDAMQNMVWIIAARIIDGPYSGFFVFDEWRWDDQGVRRTAEIFRTFNVGAGQDTLLIFPDQLEGFDAQATVTERWFWKRDISMVDFDGWSPIGQ